MPPSTSNADAVMLKAGSLQAHIVRRSGRLVAWRGAPESAIPVARAMWAGDYRAQHRLIARRGERPIRALRPLL